MSAPTELDPRRWKALAVVCAAFFMTVLDVAIVNVALPSIQKDLDFAPADLQWVLTAYAITFGGFLLLGGRAADLLGRRRVFLIALGVFAVASTLGGFADDGTLLIVTRFIKGLSAAFTAPAGLSIITTTFAEGPARNKALSIYTATGATGFSLGLVFGGLLTELGWRWVFFLPVPVALATLAGALRFVPNAGGPVARSRGFDLAGAVALTGAMLLLVFTLVEAPTAGWGSLRTLGSLAAAAAILAGFVAHERRVSAPLVRLGILRSSTLVRANLGAMSLFGGWVGFQFVTTLYLQQLRGWSPLETGLAIFPAGVLVAVISTRMAPLVMRFGVRRLIIAGMTSVVAGYVLFLPIGLDSSYAWAMLPTFIFGGLGFALAFGPVNVAATAGVAPEEQGLAGGLLNTSFQFGAALVLAVVTAVASAATPSGGTAQATLDGFHAALFVPLVAAAVGASALLFQRSRVVEVVEFPAVEEVVEEAA